MEEAAAVISELKGKFRSQGQQIITYRRKLRQQVGMLSYRRVEIPSVIVRRVGRSRADTVKVQPELPENMYRAEQKCLHVF